VKNKYASFLQFLIVFVLSLNCFIGLAQTDLQKKQITKSYDLKKIEQLKAEFDSRYKTEKASAIEAATKNGWDIYKKNADGTFDELMAVSSDGKPIYYSIENVNAAKSTRANHLNSGGSLGLSLDGQNMYAGVWDGAPVRVSHQEFGGRMVVSDGVATLNSNSFHATHVTGTIGAAGVDPAAKGMAPLSTVKTFDWNNDLTEVLAEAENGLLLSNHSYGIPIANASGNWFMGAYSSAARAWDQLSYAVPYYLMVASAGNDGNSTNPAPMTANYDKLTGNKTAKNNLVVANANDANVDASGNLISVTINSSSSEGPSDDRRIKPDITGNGTSLYSSTSGSDTEYSSLTGTSMASPNVMGTLLLLQQHYNNVNHTFMRASTLKGLACHTADDKGKVGPDPVWGWGLLNAKKAAQAITGNGLQSWISEETLHQGEVFTFTATSDGVNPLLASISWTDVPGAAVENSLNNATPVLVNDLDIRITKDGIPYYPWKLQTAANLAAIKTEDNNVDNVERINVDNPSGVYTITVTHKGTLQDGPQKFSFIVTGLSSAFSLTSLTDMQTSCVGGNATYNFNFTNSNTTATNFTASGLPNGAIATFSSPTLNASGAFSMTVSNLQNATPGIYPIAVVGDNGTETETRYVDLKISSTDFANVALNSPSNTQTGLSSTLQLHWSTVENAESFHLQLATDTNFTTVIVDNITNDTTFPVTSLLEDTQYYWRVFPLNACGAGTNATVYTFQTGHLVCNNHFEANEYSNAAISDVGTALAAVYIPVTGGFIIGDLNVNLNISHTYIGDLTIVLEGPAAINYPRITLFSEPCGDNQDINCTMDDSGNVITCNPATPGISGFVIPNQALSTLNNKAANGTWVLYVTDPYPGNGGIINNVSLDFCTVSPLLGVSENNVSRFDVYPNPSSGIVNLHVTGALEGKSTYTLHDVQGRSILNKSISSSSEVIDLENFANGVYFLSIENGNQKTTKKIILNR
jgi:subtilisin-like proprotein convertase family protein